MPPKNLKKGVSMDTIQYILLAVFVIATIVGYLVINKVPSLLHTPLMSGMNALSGVTLIGAIAATTLAVRSVINGNQILGYVMGSVAIILATINVVGGFVVTHRMLKMFRKHKERINE